MFKTAVDITFLQLETEAMVQFFLLFLYVSSNLALQVNISPADQLVLGYHQTF